MISIFFSLFHRVKDFVHSQVIKAEPDPLDLSSVPRPRPQRPRPPQSRRRPFHRPPNPNSITRFDEFGDYDYIDKSQHPKQIGYHKPLKHRPPQSPPPPGDRRVDELPRHPYYRPPFPVRRHDVRFPVRRPLRPPPAPRPQRRRPAQSFGDTFRPSPHFQRPHQPFPALPGPPPKSPFSFANGFLNLIGLEASPFSAPTQKKQPLSLDFTDGPADVPDSLDADYYADYEGGQYFQGVAKPTIMDRVAKWFEGFKPPSELMKGPQKGHRKKHINR